MKKIKKAVAPSPFEVFDQAFVQIRNLNSLLGTQRSAFIGLQLRMSKMEDDYKVLKAHIEVATSERDIINKELEVDDLAVRLSKAIRAAKSVKPSPLEALSDAAIQVFCQSVLPSTLKTTSKVFVNDGVRYILTRIP